MRTQSVLLSPLLILALALPAWALSMDDVIRMHGSKLPAAVIIQTIQSTGSTFQLKVSDLARLEKAGVPKEVIEVMMGSGAGTAPAPEPPPEPPPAEEPDELEKMREEEADERARSEEDSRIKEAARKAAEKERKRIERKRRQRVAQALKSAREALEDKEYAVAAKRFSAFLKEINKEDSIGFSARLGLADALYGLKLYGNAAEVYHGLLATGPESDVFVPAFTGLRNCSKKIAYNPVTLEALNNHFIGGAPQETQDSYNYFLGKFFFDYTRYEEARRYLGEVKPGAEDYPEAQYLLGLSYIQLAGEDQESTEWAKTIIGATENFQIAVAAAEEAEAPRIRNLAYLALARVAYSLGSFDAAIFYYRKVPSDSTSYVDALHESGWSYFLKGDLRRGLGIFHTLDGPAWENYYLPDTYLLEATVFMNKCHFDYAHDAIKRIEDKYLSLEKPISRYLQEYSSPQDLYRAFVLKQTQNGVELPHLLRMAVISSAEFYDLYTTVSKYRREIVRIKASEAGFGPELEKSLLQTVENRHLEGTIALGIKIAQLLQGLQEELKNLEVQVEEIRIEIDEDEANQIERQTQIIYNKGKSDAVKAEAESQKTATIFIGNNYVTWPFEGEYWADEINNYRSDLREVCK